MKTLVLSIAILTLCATRAESQSDSVLTRLLTDSTSLLNRLTETSEPDPARPLPIGSIRFASASGGFMFGMVLGGFSGYELESQDCTNCRNRTADALLLGATIGGAIGAAVGAAFFDLRSVCTFDRRVVRTLAGSAVGAYALFTAAGGLGKRGRSAFYIPIGAIGGSLGTLGRCWKSAY